MGAPDSANEDLVHLRSRIRKLTGLWKEKRVNEHCLEARLFLSQCRDLVRRKAIATPLRWEWIKCLQDLTIVHHRLGDTSEEILCSDEDLVIDLFRRYSPAPHERPHYLYSKHTVTSNIYKRRAFLQARSEQLGEAVDRMDEAVRAARQAIEPAAEIQMSEGATKHLRYLEYYAAILRMLASEASREFVEALAALQQARAAAEDPKAPVRLFPDYIWDRTDLDTYNHLIEAQRFLFEGDLTRAVSEYDSWLNTNQSHRGRFRFKNIEVRRQLAAVLKCLGDHCTACDRCRAARDRLEQLAQDPFIGDAGRYLAVTGAALHHAGLVAVPDVAATVQKLRQYLPILAYHWEPRLAVSESDFASLPSYFTSLPTEAKRLATAKVDHEIIRRFVIQRLREFVEICCEYEEGVNGSAEILPSRTGGSLLDLAERTIRARIGYRGESSRGAASWRSVATDLDNIEQKAYPEILDAYHSTLTRVAGLFPLIVRLKDQKAVEFGWSAEAETIDGDSLLIDSQFRLEGTLAYLSHKFRKNLPKVIWLKMKDRTFWVPASAPKWLEIQSIPLWEGNWSRIGKEFECATLDYKQALPAEIAKHLAAFANSSGGWLVFGILDPMRREPLDSAGIKGLTLTQATEILDKISVTAFRQLEPPVAVTFSRSYPDGVNVVLLCQLRASDIAPHKVGGHIYVRLGSSSKRISEAEWTAFAKTGQEAPPANRSVAGLSSA